MRLGMAGLRARPVPRWGQKHYCQMRPKRRAGYLASSTESDQAELETCEGV